MDKRGWKIYQDWLHIVHEWAKIVRPGRNDEAIAGDNRQIEYHRARRHVEGVRMTLVPTKADQQPRMRTVHDTIIRKATSAFGKEKPRTAFKVHIGKEKWGAKLGRGEVSVTIGWLWEKRVWEPLYNRGFQHDDWLILSAEQLNVNAKHIRLYQCLGYSVRLDENKKVYVGEKTTGNRVFRLAHTVKSAVNAIEDALTKEVHKNITGEYDDTSNG